MSGPRGQLVRVGVALGAVVVVLVVVGVVFWFLDAVEAFAIRVVERVGG